MKFSAAVLFTHFLSLLLKITGRGPGSGGAATVSVGSRQVCRRLALKAASCTAPSGTNQLPDSCVLWESILRQVAASKRSVSLRAAGEGRRGSHRRRRCHTCCRYCCPLLLLPLPPAVASFGAQLPVPPTLRRLVFPAQKERKRLPPSGAAWKHHSPRNDRDAGGIYPQEVRRLISSNYRKGQVLCAGGDASRPPARQPSITSRRTERRRLWKTHVMGRDTSLRVALYRFPASPESSEEKKVIKRRFP